LNWREYDERAERLERQLKAEAPLLDWRAMRADTMTAAFREPPIEDWPHRVVASVTVNGQKLRAEVEIDEAIMESCGGAAYVARLVAENMVQGIMEWKPKG